MYNIEVALDDAEVLQNLTESTSATTELHLNSVEFDYGSLLHFQPAWELLEPQLWVDYLIGLVSISEPDDSGIDLGDTDSEDDMLSLQTVSDTISELDDADGNQSVASGSMPGLWPHTDSTSSNGGGCAISVDNNGVLVRGCDWEILQLPHTRAEGAAPYTLGNVFEQWAAKVLNCYWPYWDGASTEEEHDFFLMHQISESTYAVENTASELEFFVTVDQL